jgi:predicted DNA-binding antitoxin AbrB/MazE fold protein
MDLNNDRFSLVLRCRAGGNTMSITIEAIYEAGILRLLTPLPDLADKSRVRVAIDPVGRPAPKLLVIPQTFTQSVCIAF